MCAVVNDFQKTISIASVKIELFFFLLRRNNFYQYHKQHIFFLFLAPQYK